MEIPNYIFVEYSSDTKYLIDAFDNYSTQFLTFIPRKLPEYSSHGVDHTLRIINKNINLFLGAWGIILNQDEGLLLYLDAWVHDIGCIISREEHASASIKLMQKSKLLDPFPEKYVCCLKHIILAHRKNYSLIDVPDECDNVRLRMICAIFRLMDACDITRQRCPSAVYDIIKLELGDESNEIWKAHMNIKDLIYHKPNIIIYVDDINISKSLVDNLNCEISTIKSTFEENNLIVPTIIVDIDPKN